MKTPIRDPRLTRHNLSWTQSELDTLQEMIFAGKSTAEIAEKLGRTKSSIWTRKHNLGLGVRLTRSRKKGVNMPATTIKKSGRVIQVKRDSAPETPKVPVSQAESLAGLIQQAKSLGLTVTITIQ